MYKVDIQYDEQFYDDFSQLVSYLVETGQYSANLASKIWHEIQQAIQIRAENIRFVAYKPYYIASDGSRYFLIQLKHNSVIYTLHNDAMIILFLFGNAQDMQGIVAGRPRE